MTYLRVTTGEKGEGMRSAFTLFLAAIMASCTVNVHNGGSNPPGGGGGVQAPDTTVTRHPLTGGGTVITEECGNWTRHTLTGCRTETDGTLLEIRPAVTRTSTGSDEAVATFQVTFACRAQGGSGGSIGTETGPGPGSALPVVTGTELIRILADRTTFGFLIEDAEDFQSDWLADGTISYTAVFQVEDWMMRALCTAENVIAVSGEPEFRLIFGNDARRLMQQFYDIFVIHGGSAPVLPVQEEAAAAD